MDPQALSGALLLRRGAPGTTDQLVSTGVAELLQANVPVAAADGSGGVDLTSATPTLDLAGFNVTSVKTNIVVGANAVVRVVSANARRKRLVIQNNGTVLMLVAFNTNDINLTQPALSINIVAGGYYEPNKNPERDAIYIGNPSATTTALGVILEGV